MRAVAVLVAAAVLVAVTVVVAFTLGSVAGSRGLEQEKAASAVESSAARRAKIASLSLESSWVTTRPYTFSRGYR